MTNTDGYIAGLEGNKQCPYNIRQIKQYLEWWESYKDGQAKIRKLTKVIL